MTRAEARREARTDLLLEEHAYRSVVRAELAALKREAGPTDTAPTDLPTTTKEDRP